MTSIPQTSIAALLAIAAASVLPAQAAQKTPPPQPNATPDWSAARRGAESLMKRSLADPEAARIKWVSGFSWESIKFIGFGGRKWGWFACATMNAKNLYGGYVGETTYIVQVDALGDVFLFGRSDYYSKCDGETATPLQAALLDQSPPATQSPAEELTRLSLLLDKGLITRQEFDSLKAKLMAGDGR